MFQQDAATGIQADTSALTKAVAAMTPDGIRFSADWASLLGVGEVAAAGLLLVGLATRLVVLPVLAVLGYGLFVGFAQASLPTNTTAMWLLAVACLSLLASGGGSLALRRRRHVLVMEAPPTRERLVQHRNPAHTAPGLAQRVRHWFTRWWMTRHPVQLAAKAPARRWAWWR
jgi:uncharacterized membrane protein YphA (DoxX/SURF4 family)